MSLTCTSVPLTAAVWLQVWDSYFYLSVIFINQPCLQLESFSPSKRKKTLEKWVFSPGSLLRRERLARRLTGGLFPLSGTET